MRRPTRVSAISIWYQVPLAPRILVVFTAWFSYGVLLSNLNSLDDSTRTAEIIWCACQSGTWLTILADTVIRSSFDSLDQLVAYSAALRTGEVPEDIDTGQWRRRLRHSRIAVVLTPLLVYPVLALGVMSADSSQSPHRVLFEVLLVSCAICLFLALCLRGARITRLEAEIKKRPPPLRYETPTPVDKSLQRWNDALRDNAETPLARRFTTGAAGASALAFVILVIADLDSVVYGDAGLAHLGRAALWATTTGLIVTVLASYDPRLSATSRTIEEILRYDWAFRSGQLPAQFDVEQWCGWIRSHGKSCVVMLVCACFSFAVAGWSLLSHPTGYHWIVAGLLAVLGGWQVRRWRQLCARLGWLEARVKRYAVRQLFG